MERQRMELEQVFADDTDNGQCPKYVNNSCSLIPETKQPNQKMGR